MVYRGEMRLVFMACALLLGGCGADDDVWHGDVAFTAEERSAIEDGAAFTASHTGRPVPVILWDGEDTGRRIFRRKPYPQHCDPCVAYASNDKMWIEPGFVWTHVAAHEWGHAFGMKHVDRGLMQKHVAALEWTDEDTAECAASCE